MLLVRFLVFGFLVIASASTTHAADGSEDHKSFISRFGATVGADYDYGTLQNSGLNQKSRSMNALSLEGLVGYRVGRFIFGPDFDYRFEGQLTGIGQSGGTNLKGHGWLLGLGTKYTISPKWAIQGAIDFAGKYTFQKQTDSSEDDNLNTPLIIRAKGQYFAFAHVPLSFDLDCQYVSYAKWHVTSVDYSSSTNGFLIGLGLTWHFGGERTAGRGNQTGASDVSREATPESAADVTNETITAPPKALNSKQLNEMQSDLERVVDVKRVDNGLLVNIKGDMSFAPGGSDLKPEAKANLAKTAAILLKARGTKIRIVGHSDSSGLKTKNQELSEARAASVRDIFVANGFSTDRVTTAGVGDNEPMASNKTIEGRATNRRVEIHVEKTTVGNHKSPSSNL